MDVTLSLVLLLSPFIGFLINVFFGKSLGKSVSGFIGTLSVVISFFATIYFFMDVNQSAKPIKVCLFDCDVDILLTYILSVNII